jgi:nucleoside-diphosphate-sugar epimerase
MSRRVLITGATGFIGGRLAEIACDRGDDVVAIVRNWSRAARLARLPVRMLGGDLLDTDALTGAMKGCDVVFHCAVDNRATGDEHIRAGVIAIENVMRAAHACGARRVVHLSSVAVYGLRPMPDAATEAGASGRDDDAYVRGKIEAERAALDLHRDLGVPLVILRPTIVYGPFGSWTIDTVDRIRRGRQAIVDEGVGVCNVLYVDNLVDAMFLAAEPVDAAGQVFHVSDARPVTWRRFVESHAVAASIDPTTIPQCSASEAAAGHVAAEHARRPMTSLRRTSELLRDTQFRRALTSVPLIERSLRLTKRVAQTVLPAAARAAVRRSLMGEEHVAVPEAPPAAFPSPAELDIYTTDVVFEIDKARRLLSYKPRIDFDEGMRRTGAWIQWARLNNS